MPAESTPEPGIPGEPGTSAPRQRGKGRRRKARSTRRKALLITAWTAAGVVVLGGTGAGILYFKGGPVALVVLTNENEDKSFTPDNAGNRLCADIAKVVVEYFAKPSDQPKK